MKRKCPRCLAESPSAARFCGRCGLSLTPGQAGQLTAGRVLHPHPAATLDGFLPCIEAEHLYYRWGPPSGQSFLLGTEPIAVSLFNGAYPLEEVQMVICGKDDQGWVRFSVTQTVESLPVGEIVKLEIPSYELSDEATKPVHELEVTLVSAAFGPAA